MTTRRAFVYRLYPTPAQAVALQGTLERCRELYNACLEERREAYHHGERVTLYSQKRQLPAIKAVRPEYATLDAQMLQDVIYRVDRAFQGFFRRVREGRAAGYPRFRSRDRYDSFTFWQTGWKLTDGRLSLRGIDPIRVKWSRPIEGTIKTVTVRRDADQWYVSFSCAIERAVPAPSDKAAIGIDMGLEYFATLSTGEHIENPRHFRKGAAVLARRQQALARKNRGSMRRRKAKLLVVKAHRKVRHQRRDFHHKTANAVVAQAGAIAVEALQTANMVLRPAPKQDESGHDLPNGAAAKSGLNKSITDAGWAQFLTMLGWKAAEAAIPVVAVTPAGTSQICSGCGAVVHKDLSDRWHTCACGVSLQRDHNAARTILQRAGLARQAATGAVA